MRSVMFLAASVCAICIAAFSGMDLQAKCRCQRGVGAAVRSTNRAARHQYRAERKCQRRGVCAVADNQQQPNSGGYYNPYGQEGIKPIGPQASAAPPEPEWKVTHTWTGADGRHYQQECNGRSCRIVRIVPIPAKVDAPQPQPEAEAPPETQTPEETGAVWRPDPPQAESQASQFPPGVINGT